MTVDLFEFNDAPDKRVYFCTAWDLTPQTRKHLYDSAMMLWDGISGDVEEVYDAIRRGRAIPPLTDLRYLRECLPAPYAAAYTPLFYRQFDQTFAVVIHKLAAGAWGPGALLSCVAEELALAGLIEHADVQLTIRRDAGEPADELDQIDFDDLWDLCFEDHDWKYLFDAASDGIQDSALGAELGIGHLDVSEWFDAFGTAGMLPHPCSWRGHQPRPL